MKIEKRYIFQAHAVAASAHIRGPVDRILQIPAATALPVTGGYGRSEAGRTVLDGLIALDAATAEVEGDFIDKDRAAAQRRGELAGELAVRVTAAATVTNLEFLQRVHVAKLSARLVAEDSQKDQPRISFDEDPAPIVGFSIDGFPLNVEIDSRFNELNTLQALEDKYREDADFRKEYVDRFAHNGEEHSLFHPYRIPAFRGRILTSIVKELSWAGGAENPRAKIHDNNQITVAGLGEIYVGEFFISECHRRLTLLRIVLGADDDRCSSYGEVGAPGTPWN